MHSNADDPPNRVSPALARGAFFLAFWLTLSGVSVADLPAGLLAAAIAAWVSLRLMPPGQQRLRPILLSRLFLRFLYQSIVAGADVAWRALDPRLPLRPGAVIYRPSSPPGTIRSGFCTMASLQPGLLPCGVNADGNLVVHCLDVGLPVADQLAEEETRLLLAIEGRQRHG